MNKKKFAAVLEECPRVVPVFMVKEKTDQLSQGEIVYWSWLGKLMSHRGEVVEPDCSKFDFVGYAPIINLGDHVWPNLAAHIEL